MRLPLLPFAFTLSVAAHAASPRDNYIQHTLDGFQQDPRPVLQSIPPKWDNRGRAIPREASLFPPEITRNRDFVLLKNRYHPHARIVPMAPIDATDRPESMVDRIQWNTLPQMERARATQAALPEQPWSGDYWPLYNGSIARRFADPSFPDSMNWKTNSDFLLNAPATSSSITQLSPAEKYDLLVGDSQRTLTRSALAEGENYFRENGQVESWMGICHGWAPASFMETRPERAVEVLAADGITKILFYPDDLKALASQLWANARYATQWTGNRCNDKDPKTDANGRVLPKDCFDDNPATWHLAVVNQIAGAKRGFVLDAAFDYQVWNQPVQGYRYTYFNPQTGKPAQSLQEATVNLRDFRDDKFRAYRGRNSRSVVGIAMDVTYMSENSPLPKMQRGPEDDNQVTALYMYDLELDDRGAIIGGEWYSNAHPDFLWTPAPGAHAISEQDYQLDQQHPGLGWNGQTAVPAEWREAAIDSAREGIPLAKIVESLLALSRIGR